MLKERLDAMEKVREELNKEFDRFTENVRFAPKDKNYFKLLSNRFNQERKPVLRGYFFVLLNAYLDEENGLASVVESNSKNLKEITIPFLSELLITLMYYDNQILDEKGGVNIKKEINKNLIHSKVLFSEVLNYIDYSVQNDKQKIEIIRLVNDIYAAVTIGQEIEMYNNHFDAWKSNEFNAPKHSYEPENIKIINVLKKKLFEINELKPIFNSKFFHEYLRRIYFTNAYLFVKFSKFIIENRCSNCRYEEEKILNFCGYTGILLQIVNDISDLVPTRLNQGSKAKISGDAFSDLKNRNVTLPLILYLNQEDTKYRPIYNYLNSAVDSDNLSDDDTLINELFSESLNSRNILDYAIKIARNIKVQSLNHINKKNKNFIFFEDVNKVIDENRFLIDLSKINDNINKKIHIMNNNKRGVVAFPNIDAFYELLHYKIHAMIERCFLEQPFTIFINALPRNHEPGTKLEIQRSGTIPLVYAGTQSQVKLLTNTFPQPNGPKTTIEDAEKSLNDTRNTFTLTEGVIGGSLFGDFVGGAKELNHLRTEAMGSLTDYFAPLINKTEEPGPFQEEEYAILSHFLDINEYNYLSLPLIQFAEVDGLVHLVYHKSEEINFINSKGELRKKTVGALIKMISQTYEETILTWDIKNGKEFKDRAYREFAQNPAFHEQLSINKLLKELKYLEYYKKYEQYFQTRIEQSDEVPEDAKEAYRTSALTNILMDSYTHNISAHSMVALESWLSQRALFQSTNGTAAPDLDFIDFPFIKDNRSYDREMHEFIRFMLNKGAFWTGLHRDRNYGGKAISLYEVLYEDFISNPLFLGTIAFSEGISRLNLHITFVERQEDVEQMAVQFKKKVILDDLFATIDLGKWIEHKPHPALEPDQYLSGFVELGKNFMELQEKLRHCLAFFPGGVVGVHAFLTILENEIRNVKHFSDEAIDDMRKNGLNLNISIEERSYPKNEQVNRQKSELFQIGVWLRHQHAVSLDTIKKRLGDLYGDIINEQNMPKLGGTTQDKICSAFLFNSFFSSVQPNRMSKRDKWYFPWIKAGFCSETDYSTGDTFTEFEISARRLVEPKAVYEQIERKGFEASRAFFEDNYKEEPGYYKKYFYMWRGEDIFDFQYYDNSNALNVSETKEESWENLSRFKFVELSPQPNWNDSILRMHTEKLRKDGVIRIIDQNVETLDQAYSLWLKKWLKPDQKKGGGYRIRFSIVKKDWIAALDWDGTKVSYVTKKTDNSIGLSVAHAYNDLSIVHGKDNSKADAPEIRYRSHGILIQYFMGGVFKMHLAAMDNLVAAELMETLATRICIFDKRIHKWFQKVSLSKMESLGCEVYEEHKKAWNKVKEQGFFKYHFLIVHLSFIESLQGPDRKKYTEETIHEFIENEILQGQQAPDNFVLVITSGRGRKHWQYVLEQKEKDKQYSIFVTSRPLESLHHAVASSQVKFDDFETKYNLVKILLGS
jgi:geranylgeranyl pyrophosphate synthase